MIDKYFLPVLACLFIFFQREKVLMMSDLSLFYVLCFFLKDLSLTQGHKEIDLCFYLEGLGLALNLLDKRFSFSSCV